MITSPGRPAAPFLSGWDGPLEHPDAPEPHNLLGIWFELKGNEDKAHRHYRAACALDPTFMPARKNLERICRVFDIKNQKTYDYGVEALEMIAGKDDKHQVKHT